MVNMCVQGFAVDNMKTWKAHWDRQLYKALEHQFQMGLEALNENLPEIKVELTYAWVQLAGELGKAGTGHWSDESTTEG